MDEANDILKRVDIVDGVDINYRETTTWYGGIPITIDLCDGDIYREKDGVYYRKTIDSQTLLKINNIAELRLQEGYYLGQEISLLGYYVSGDKKPLGYKYTIDAVIDDGGSIIKTSKGAWIAQLNAKLAADRTSGQQL